MEGSQDPHSRRAVSSSDAWIDRPIYIHFAMPPRLASLSLLIAVLLGPGCTTSSSTRNVQLMPAFEPVQADSNGLEVRLTRVLTWGEPTSEVGWLECELLLENRGRSPVVVSTAKLLTASGRYLTPAASYEEILVPPSPADEIGEDMATSAAGIAAGQVIPHGGLLVKAITSLSDASTADARARAEQRFRLRRIAEVELAPGGRMDGSAFFPRVADPQALVVEISGRGGGQRLTLPWPGH